MADESSPLLPPAEESIEAETDAALAQEPKAAEPAPDAASEATFVCDCEEWMRSACEGLSFFKLHENKRYCVLHYPGKEKSADFKTALDSKVNRRDFNFRGVWFPEQVSFSGFEFSEAADFRSATFSAAADFTSATFKAAAYFTSATFKAGADFRSATFSTDADFNSASFSADAYFSHATFSADTDFTYAKFLAGAYFSRSLFHASVHFFEATFDGSVQFFGSATEREPQGGARLAAMAFGNNPSLDFQHVVVEHSDRIAFHTLTLRPHWFVNTDCRLFGFIDVDWDWERISIKQEISALEAKEVESPNRLLAIACRQLAENAEANSRYEEASKFRYWAMELQRQEMDPIWKEEWYEFAFWRLDWWYWATSGYGERIVRALLMLLGIWAIFVLLYTRVGFVHQPPSDQAASSATAASVTVEDKIGQPLEFARALTYSLGVMSLQKPEPKPLTGTAQALVLLETILGPVQAALLALAIRRKFMR
jgi:hypothetical protein